MTYHAMFSLYIMTGLLALVISVSLFCKSVAEAKEWKRKFGERNWDYLSRPVICLETGERFESISLVSRMLGISKSNVFHAMKNGSAVHGIHFYYGDELKPDDSFFKPKRRRKVRCTETGVVYESIKDAAERTKISPNGIGSAASGMSGGYHWEYADD